jgi:hypothetical protein
MIILNYEYNLKEIKKLSNIDLSIISSTDIDYYLFCGNIIFRVNDRNFDALWGWIPIIDFATNLFLILSKIKEGESEIYYFTESEATIKFHRKDGSIMINPSYCLFEEKVVYEEMKATTHQFLKRVLTETSVQFPQLSKNSVFIERLELCESRVEK